MILVIRYDEFGDTVVVSEFDNERDAKQAAARFANDTPGVTYHIRGAQGELIGKIVRGENANTNE